ncbi:MAG: hypothetical protein ACKOE6_01480, partial [Flammeovirgaceae bacterium]
HCSPDRNRTCIKSLGNFYSIPARTYRSVRAGIELLPDFGLDEPPARSRFEIPFANYRFVPRLEFF